MTCSKGTYVRSLIRDLGEYLGTCACMSYLVRVQAGVFTIEDAATLEELTRDPVRYVLPSDASMGAVRKVTPPGKMPVSVAGPACPLCRPADDAR